MQIRVLPDFLNYGILPFVGRTGEYRRLLQFWKETPESDRLRVALLVGEAGIGKSRLVAEMLPDIEKEGGISVHTKIYPGSTTSIISPIARALWSSGTGRTLLRREPEPTLGSVVQALQRLTRLRPTVLIIEDIHLLAEDSLNELTSLFSAMAAEPLSVIALARPVEHGMRGVLDRYLIEEIELGGLTREQLEELWTKVFTAPAVPGVIEMLREYTLGNPLALRSAIRGMMKSGAIALVNGVWVNQPSVSLPSVLQQNVETMSSGLTVHLEEEEQMAAERLAQLGEVFSREAAEMMVPDSESMLRRLQFKGIIASSCTSMSHITGSPSHSPYIAFSHTVLHDQLIRRARVAVEPLVEVIVRDLPLCSVLPLQLIGEHAASYTFDPAIARVVIERALALAAALNKGPDWPFALSVCEVADAVFRSVGERWEPCDRHNLQAAVLHRRLLLFQRGTYSEEYAAHVDRFLELTANPSNRIAAEGRIQSLIHLHELFFRRAHEWCEAGWNEAEELLRMYPELSTSEIYGEYLQTVTRIAWAGGKSEMFRRLEERVESITSDERLADDGRRRLRAMILPFILNHFETSAELELRLRQLAELESIDPDSLLLLSPKCEMLFSIGRYNELLPVIERGLPQLREHGLTRFYNRYLFVGIVARAALGGSLQELERQMENIMSGSLGKITFHLHVFMGRTLRDLGILRGDLDWGGRMSRRVDDGRPLPASAGEIVMAAHEGRLDDLIAARSGEIQPAMLRTLAASAVDGIGLDEEGLAMVEAALTAPLLRTSDLLCIHAVSALLYHTRRADDAREQAIAALRQPMAGALLRALEWLADRSLSEFMLALIDHHESWLSTEDAASWRARAEEIAANRPVGVTGRDGRIEISLLGTIEARTADGPPQRIRGARLSTLLGVMVADQLLGHPLSFRDFCRIASGGERDPEYARKMINGAVWRLRDVIGYETIVTSETTPRLNMNLARVDLLDAHDNLMRAVEAVRSGSLVRAVPLLHATLDAAGEVAFPGLYDDFFESAREDFENKLRVGIIEVSGNLLREQDPARAEEILRKACAALPGDEELTALWCEALVMLDRRAEAELVRTQHS